MVMVSIASLDVVLVQIGDGRIGSQVLDSGVFVIIIIVIVMASMVTAVAVVRVVRFGNAVVLGSEESERSSAIVEDSLGGRNQPDQLGDLRVPLRVLVEQLPDGQLGVFRLGVADPFSGLGVGVRGSTADGIVDGFPFREGELGNVLGLLSPREGGKGLSRQWQ